MSNALPERAAQRETSRQVRECAAAEPLNKAVTPFSVTFSHPARDKDSHPSLLPALHCVACLYSSGAKLASQLTDDDCCNVKDRMWDQLIYSCRTQSLSLAIAHMAKPLHNKMHHTFVLRDCIVSLGLHAFHTVCIALADASCVQDIKINRGWQVSAHSLQNSLSEHTGDLTMNSKQCRQSSVHVCSDAV